MSKRLQSLALITFAACLPHAAAPQTPEQQLAGSNHLVFRNQFDVPICSIYFESYLEGERVLVQLLEGPGGPDDHIKLAPGAEKTFDAGAHTFEITVEACNHVEIGSLRRVDVKGPMVLGIGGKVTDVPAGFTTDPDPAHPRRARGWLVLAGLRERGRSDEVLQWQDRYERQRLALLLQAVT